MTITTTVCIVGGGPAGMMLGYLLARAGIDVTVLEKHADFFRDFRGDTVHPSTLNVLGELGILDDFLTRPHQKTHRLRGYVGDEEIIIANLSALRTRCPYIAFMPQWDFLDFLTDHAKSFPNFHLLMSTKATGLIEENGRTVGIRAVAPEGDIEIRSSLVVACDGRHSDIRHLAGLVPEELGAPIDVLWFAIPRRPEQPLETLGMFKPGRIIAMINRQEYWQCAFVINKGGAEDWQKQPIENFRRDVAETVPFLAADVDTIKSWDDVKLLTVTVNRLHDWCKPGLLCIGDAAHAMSPAGGVGINLAIQDAVATANLLVEPLRKGTPSLDDLKKIQKRRLFPTRVIQRLQIGVQNNILSAVLRSNRPLRPNFILRLMQRFPLLAVIPAYIVGIGPRPEHVRIDFNGRSV